MVSEMRAWGQRHLVSEQCGNPALRSLDSPKQGREGEAGSQLRGQELRAVGDTPNHQVWQEKRRQKARGARDRGLVIFTLQIPGVRVGVGGRGQGVHIRETVPEGKG